MKNIHVACLSIVLTKLVKYTFNESYNRPPYILAASTENENKKSMFFLFYTEEESLPK